MKKILGNHTSESDVLLEQVKKNDIFLKKKRKSRRNIVARYILLRLLRDVVQFLPHEVKGSS